MYMKKILICFIALYIVLGGMIFANQDLVIPKTRLEYINPERNNFDEKIQYGLEEIL